MSSNQTESFLVFKEAASKSLGLGDDESELIALDNILARMEDLYSRDVSRFELIIEAIRRDEVYWSELECGIEKFRGRLTEHFGIQTPKLRALQFVPIEEPVFKRNVDSEAQLRFFQKFGSEYNFNRMRGGFLLHFMLARFIEENERFNGLSIGIRSRLVSYSGNLESAYSIWENNNLGRVWTLPSAALPRNAYSSATYRLVDGLCSAADFDATYQIFKSHLNPLRQFPIQLLYNVIMSDPKTVLQARQKGECSFLHTCHVSK